jgi:hypothetical protein
MILFLEIVFATLVGLVVLSLTMATVRALVHGPDKPWFPAEIPTEEHLAAVEPYWHRALVAIDVCFNVVLWFGRQGETISTNSYIASLEGKFWGKILNWWLNGIQSHHGLRAACGDLWRSTTEAKRLKKLLKV